MQNDFYKTTNIKDVFKFDKILGEGSFAVVHKAIKKDTNEEFAVKIFDKSRLSYEEQEALQTECEIMANIDHPNIVKCISVFDDKRRFYIVMELMTGGELFDRIVDKEFYSEKEACEIIKPIADAVSYCHKMGIAHRDLKPENLLYTSTDPNASIKISDFGLAKVISEELMTTACGSPSYIAPEILGGKGYSFSVDCWSIGVILYVLLCGFPPFQEETNEKLFERIKKGQLEFPSPQWDPISSQAKDLIRGLLKVNPEERLNSEQILNHLWIKEGEIASQHLPESLEALRQLNTHRGAQSAILFPTRLIQLVMEKWLLGMYL